MAGKSAQDADQSVGAESARMGTGPVYGLPAGLGVVPVWRMLLYFVLTLGLYSWIWLGLRREAFNSLDSPCKLWKWLFWTAFLLGFVSGLFGDAVTTPALASTYAVLALNCSVASALGYFFLLMCARAALQDHLAAQGVACRINRLWLLLFGCLYLQYVLNRVHERLARTLAALPALQTLPNAASTPP